MTTKDMLDRILERLGQVRLRCPELRFGQLIAIVGELAEDETAHALWDVEDSEFAAALERFANDLARRGATQVGPNAVSDRGGMMPPVDAVLPDPPRQVN